MQELLNDLTQRIKSLGAVIVRCRKLNRDVTELYMRREFLEENLRLLKNGYRLPKDVKVKEEWWRRPVVCPPSKKKKNISYETICNIFTVEQRQEVPAAD